MHQATGLVSKRVSQRWILEAIQRGDSFVYALVTREGAIKVGVSTQLAQRKGNIGFGGTKHYLAYQPGTLDDERDLHARLAPHRIFGTREYYYPTPEVLPVINEMRDWMGVRHLRRRDLPRLASCTFHRRVQDAQRTGGSVFT